MIPRFRPPLGWREFAAALDHRGPDDIAAFERAFAAAVGQSEAIAFPYGRTAQLALLNALDVKGREIICPAYTCVVVPHAIHFAGARPLFIDSGADANMDLDAAEAAITERTAALIATSIFGNPVDLDRLAALQTRHPHVVILQDCAHSFTAEWNGRRVNRAGRAAFFGLNVSKILTSIFGGAATTDDPDLAARLRAERDRLLRPAPAAKSASRLVYMTAVSAAFSPPLFGLTEGLRASGFLDALSVYYDPARIDMPDDYLDAMTPLEARVGAAQAKRLDDFIVARRAYAEFYHRALSDVEGLAFVPSARGATYSHVAARVADRPAVMAACARAGVQLGEIIEYSCPEMPVYAADAGAFAWPIAGALARQTINLPIASRFHENRARKAADVLRRVLQGQKPPSALPKAGAD